ncbi:DUF4870 domain-containing protein [Dokdonella sp.]|uniref:DUF4870 domain-containing protein n=1 Tax=Dokdonella sp. TaxID=2291710 RepID=UPI002635772F|nr:DUF4870 domain-containing protein [Dokdonella sp.]
MNETSNPTAGVPVAVSGDERNWALLAHLSTFSFFFSVIGFILGPLIVWLVKREQSPFVAEHAKEALNFNITVAIAFVALVAFTIMTLGIGVILTWPAGVALFIAWVALPIVAAIRASEGVAYRYPFTLRLVK